MQTNTVTAGTADAPSPAILPQYASAAEKYTDEQVRQFVPRSRIRLTRVRSSAGDEYDLGQTPRQVIAYADPRAYTDRLNALFTCVVGLGYAVQVIQNFERKDRGNENA